MCLDRLSIAPRARVYSWRRNDLPAGAFALKGRVGSGNRSAFASSFEPGTNGKWTWPKIQPESRLKPAEKRRGRRWKKEPQQRNMQQEKRSKAFLQRRKAFAVLAPH